MITNIHDHFFTIAESATSDLSLQRPEHMSRRVVLQLKNACSHSARQQQELEQSLQ
jgi:hypothetical protein